jgi:nicotinamidase-related amidase
MRATGDKNVRLHGNVPDSCRVALLLVDVINDLRFPGNSSLVRNSARLGKRISRLKARCKKLGIPTIYVNDNRGKWRSNFTVVLSQCIDSNVPGHRMVPLLAPDDDDYIVLKPKNSAFYATPLDTILAYLETRVVILCGLATDACILTTAADLHVRDFHLVVPSDCVMATRPVDHRQALRLMEQNYDARTISSARLDLQGLRSRAE